MHVIRYEPTDPGEAPIELIPFNADSFDAQPLSHDDFVECIARGRSHYPLKITNALLVASEGKPDAQAMTVTTEMGLPSTPTLFGLVLGGWLPFPFAAKRTALLDRNVVSHIATLAAEDLKGSSQGASAPTWPYCSFDLAGEQVSPLLYVFEGRHRRTPTLDEIAAEAMQGTEVLRSVLPNAKVLDMGKAQQTAVMNMLQERAESLERRQSLLLKASSLVSQPVGQRHRPQVEAEILALSRTHSVPPKSFPVVALLSCLYDGHDAPSHPAFRPGRAVLKPTATYTKSDAYNALADLSFLELMLQFPSVTPGVEYVLYTRDKGLAALWSALRPWLAQDAGASLTPMFTLDRSMFPGLTEDEAVALAGRLEHESQRR